MGKLESCRPVPQYKLYCKLSSIHLELSLLGEISPVKIQTENWFSNFYNISGIFEINYSKPKFPHIKLVGKFTKYLSNSKHGGKVRDFLISSNIMTYLGKESSGLSFSQNVILRFLTSLLKTGLRLTILYLRLICNHSQNPLFP